jgi:hypothetical protein
MSDPNKQHSISLTPEHVDLLRLKAIELNCSFSQALRTILTEYIKGVQCNS